MALYGNANPSALASAAKAELARRQVYQDDIQAYQYSMSARAPEDLQAYQKYLDQRMGQETDPIKQLSLQKTKDSAFRNFVTAEIGRRSISTLEGTGTDQDKYNTIADLFHMAQQNGDDYLAQTLLQRADTLSVKMQNDAYTAAHAGGGGRGGGGGSSSVTKAITKLDHIDKALHTAVTTGSTLKDPLTGQEFKILQDKNGNPVGPDGKPDGQLHEDPNGRPLRLDANSYALIQGQAYMTKEKMLKDAITSGLDTPDGSLYNKLVDLYDNKQFQEYTNPNIIASIQRGEKPFAVKVNEDGTRDIASRRVMNQGVDPKTGQPFIQYEAGVGGKGGTNLLNESTSGQGRYTYERKAGLDPNGPNGPNDFYNVPLLHGDHGAYQIDPETNRTVYIRDDASSLPVPGFPAGDQRNTRAVATDSKGNPLTDPAATAAQGGYDSSRAATPADFKDNGGAFDLHPAEQLYSGLAKGVGDRVSGLLAANHAYLSAAQGGLQALGRFNPQFHALGAVGSFLANNFLHRTNDAALAAQEQQRQIAAQIAQRNAAAAAAIQGAPTPQRAVQSILRAVPRNNFFLPVLPASPAQTFQASLGNNKSPQNVAKAIGNAVGYNF